MPARFTPRPVRRGLWFPAALAGLLLLALPGAVLLALALLGHESAVNGWLQGRLGLSYHLAVPGWLGLLVLLVLPLLVLLYFLKLKRRPLQVPSTFLWRKSIEDMQVNSLFQWLRDNVLLLVQLLIALLLVYGVLGIQVHGRVAAGRHYILLIDHSASMSARDVAPSRLEAAKQEALREIDAHADGDTGMVIAFSSRAAILQPYTADRGLLRQAVAGIGPTQRTTRLDEALGLAESLANPHKSTANEAVRPAGAEPGQARQYVDVQVESVAAEVHLFSDGRFADVPSFAAGNLHLHYHRIGPADVDNVGLVALNAVRDDRDPARLQVFARVLNFGKNPVDAAVELEWRVAGRNDFALREQPLSLPGRTTRVAAEGESADVPGEGAVTFELADVDDSRDLVLHAHLKGWRDSFPLDDEAWLVVGVVRKARVLIVTPGNEVLHDFFDLDATARVAEVAYLIPADLKDEGKYGRPARAGAFDLVVFDRCAPPDENALPLANTFFIGSVPPPWQRSALPLLEDTRIRNHASTHPLMRHLTGLDGIAFSEAFRFDLRDRRVPPRTPRLLETGRDSAVLFVLARRSFQDLVLAFPLVNDKGEWASTWPLRLSFPIFLRNVLYSLGNVRDAAAAESAQPGQVKELRPDAAVDRVEVTDPGQGRATLARGPGNAFLYNDTERVGVYRAAWPGGQRPFAVNLLDPDESDTRPRDEVRIGAQHLESAPPRRQVHETWQWVALAALALLVLEWVAYHRRTLAQ